MAALIGEAIERYDHLGMAGSPAGALFDRSCYIELAFGAAQLKTIRHYIKLNPARKLWKSRHPDRFIRRARLGLHLARRARASEAPQGRAARAFHQGAASRPAAALRLSAEDSRELAADRLLIISGFGDEAPISSYEMKRESAAAHTFRARCLAMNELIAMLVNVHYNE